MQRARSTQRPSERRVLSIVSCLVVAQLSNYSLGRESWGDAL